MDARSTATVGTTAVPSQADSIPVTRTSASSPVGLRHAHLALEITPGPEDEEGRARPVVDDRGAVPQDREPLREGELAGTLALTPEFADQTAVLVDHDDPGHFLVQHEEAAFPVKGHLLHDTEKRASPRRPPPPTLVHLFQRRGSAGAVRDRQLDGVLGGQVDGGEGDCHERQPHSGGAGVGAGGQPAGGHGATPLRVEVGGCGQE